MDHCMTILTKSVCVFFSAEKQKYVRQVDKLFDEVTELVSACNLTCMVFIIQLLPYDVRGLLVTL